MSGPKVVNSLLSAYTSLTNVVPAARIVTGRLKQSVQLPAISVLGISDVPRNLVASTATKLRTARVQVSVKAKSYAEQKQIIALVRAALPRSRGTVAGVAVDSILPDIEGPDVEDEEKNIYIQSADFIVRYTE